MAPPDETALCVLAKRKVETGALPPIVSEKLFAGNGYGLSCSLCEQAITASDYEFEFADRGGEPLRFHLRCQEVWRVAVAEWNDACRA